MKQWSKLLYLDNGPIKVSNPSFYLTNIELLSPKNELLASLKKINQEKSQALGERFACIFPARYKFFLDQGLVKEVVECEELDKWLYQLSTERINLVYAAQYASNPASAFGHVFLMLQTSDITPYMNVAINYAAQMPEDVSTLSYVWKGITGGFSGSYSSVPLYKQIQLYKNIEDRDLFSYPIDLSPQERDFLLRHLWEVKDRFVGPYYFLDGNCASVILSFLNVARPDHDFTDNFFIFVSPPEIISVLKKYNLISSSQYWPAQSKQLGSLYSKLSREQKIRVEGIYNTKKMPEEKLSGVELETLVHLVDFDKSKNLENLSKVQTDFHSEVRNALSRLDVNETIGDSSYETSRRFLSSRDESHSAWSLKGGLVHQASNLWSSIGIRPAFHNLLDSQVGYNPFSSLVILDTNLIVQDDKKIQLDNMTFFKIENYQVSFLWNNSFSFKLDAGLASLPYDLKKNQQSLYLDSQIGKTWEMAPSLRVFFHSFLPLNSFETEEFSSIGFGGRIGGIYSTDLIRMNVSFVEAHQFSKKLPLKILDAQLGWSLSKNLQAEVVAKFFESLRTHQKTAVGLRFFF